MTAAKNILAGKYWDEAWYLVHGCKEVSPGCDNCWARAAAHMRRKHPNPKIKSLYQDLTKTSPFKRSGVSGGDKRGGIVWNGKIRFNEDALDKPLNRPSGTVFSVWNDLFYEYLGDACVMLTFTSIIEAERQMFLALTKRADRMKFMTRKIYDYLMLTEPIPNLALGVTVETPQYITRLKRLSQTPAACRFVSFEPLLQRIIWTDEMFEYMSKIDWVIVGCETGLRRRSVDLKYIHEIVDLCNILNIPVFVKSVEIDGKIVSQLHRLPKSLQFRQFPELANLKTCKLGDS